ncbi:MAG: insulinase family protein [Bacteroidales bacterium]|nr:insulinase family protein [Bacteroidales bacterium]
MNRGIIVIVLFFISFSLKAQILHVPTTPLVEEDVISAKTKEFTLENGMKVYLFPNSKMPDVMGAVVVRGGASLDAKDGEGTAHYFEHMMFKGSQKLGTINYKAEKVYLDSIREAYELLALADGDEVFRNGMLKKIDRLSQNAAEFAIPNEFSKVMASIGSTRLNAYTTYENIVYHNHFPAESMDVWLKLQVDRFSYPVFRLFQSELETVYEEKNMSMDNSFRNIFEELYKNFYPNSVYGKQTVLGSVESLKTPSISKMETYFKKYYVGNNMALILVGNFDIEDIYGKLNMTFGSIRHSDSKKPEISGSESAFDGRVIVKKKMSPIPIGILGFRTVPKGHDDELVLEVINQLLSNEQSTGLLDQLSLSNDLMFVQSIMDNHYDMGGSFIAYATKPFVQSLSNGENLVLEQLNKLKQGDFSDDLLKAVIVNKQKEFTLGMESADFQTNIIIDAFMSNQLAEKKISNYTQLKRIDKRLITAVATKYYGDNYLAFQSKMGFPKTTKIEKPDITPLNPANLGEQSSLARIISNIGVNSISPKFIDFENDVLSSDIYGNLHLYFTKNSINNIYSFQLKIGVGTYEKMDLEFVSEYLNMAGIEKKGFKDFRTGLQLTGTAITTHVDRSFFYIDMTGFDDNFQKDLQAIKQLLTKTERNEDAIKKVVKEASMEYKFIKGDLAMQSKALHDYAVYGNQSPFLRKLSKKDMKKMTIDGVLSSINSLLKYETEIHYVGGKPVGEVKSIIESAGIFSSELIPTPSPVFIPLPVLAANGVYYMNNKKAVQSHIKITIPSKRADISDREYVNAFNKYFGLGMSSMAFREIREYRSLAYGVYAYLNVPFSFFNSTSLIGAMTTQGDKTNEAVSTFINVIDSMPSADKNFETYRSSLLLSFNSNSPTLRNQSKYVAYWKRQGYKKDPRVSELNTIRNMKLIELKSFHTTFVFNHKYVLSVVGDSKRINMEQFKENFGNYTTLKLKQIYKK